ncbi:MAG: hypothetical protein ACI8UO_003972 [Verrucomicrobiales bacterium]|jgi:hypothetical protein
MKVWISSISFFATASILTAADPADFLDRHCIDCHDDETKKGSLSLESIANFGDAKPETWAAILDQVQLSQMPPKDKRQPDFEAKQQFAAWIGDSLRGAGHHVVNRLEWPNYGNYVDHDALFRADPHPSPATPVRLWRKRPETYTHKNRQGIQPFSMLPGQQISDFSALFSVDESSAEIVLRNTQQLLESVTQIQLVGDKLTAVEGTKAQAVYFPILHPDNAPTEEEFAKTLSWQFYQTLDRPATEEEISRVRQLYDAVTEAHGRLQAGRAALAVPVLKPDSLYRLELGSGELDEHGRRRLTKHEILQAVHHTLTDTHPHPAIHETKNAELATREEVAQLVREIIGGEKPNARVLAFFGEYFDYRKATAVFKEVPAGVDFNASVLTRDTQRLIEHIVTEDRDVLRHLLTTNLSFINDESDLPRNHRIYNLPGDWKWRDGLIKLDTEERAGVLTQPSWLVAHSGNFDNDPVRRGKWVLEHLLGGTVPDLPISVCAVVPEDDEKTLRERFEVIRNDAYCWKCHRQMNPLGMPFESYDHFGRYRLNELRKPVVTSGAIIEIGDPSVDGDVPNAIELIHRLAKSKRTQEVFVRYAFRYFLGRNETVRDAKTLQEANRAYEESGGSFRELVISLMGSDSFLYRAPEL